jgi:hypothetical protein
MDNITKADEMTGTVAAPYEAIPYLVDARVALDNLRALNGCDHYHDAMRAVTFAAQALGVSTNDLVAMAAGRSTGTAA